MFYGPHEVEHGNVAHPLHAVGLGCIEPTLINVDAMDEFYWERIEARPRRVRVLVRLQLSLNAEVDDAKDVQPRVAEAQSGERLANHPEVRL